MDLRNQFLRTFEEEEIYLLVDKDGKVEYVNKQIESVLCFPPSEITGTRVFNITELESCKKLKALISEANRKVGKPIFFRGIEMSCLYGLPHFFDGAMTGKESNGKKRFAIYLHNVTARKYDSEKLSLLNLELDEFIYKASHDLRSPLLSIEGLINVMEKSEPSEMPEYASLMRRSVKRLDQFITQLTHYTRNNSNPLLSTSIDFKSLFANVVNNYRSLPNSDKIKFYIDAEDARETYSDYFRLEIIICNLLSNAIKYHNINQPHPYVRISVKYGNDSFKVSVIDNGTGIDKQNVERIFNMFMRGTSTSDGSGLGLYIVKKALDKIEGKIEVKSEVNGGSKFTVTIPNKVKNPNFITKAFELA